MKDFLTNPAAWAAIGVLLAAIGVELPQGLIHHICEAIAAIMGIIGILFAARDANDS
jgi:uncharacterized membrane protein